MMRMKTFAVAALMSIAILTGCDKDRNEVVVANPGSATTNPSNDPGVNAREVPVTYELQPVIVDGPIARVPFDWVSAHGMVTDIKFDAKSNEGDVSYKSNSGQRVELFSPDSRLGDVTVPAGTYDKIMYKIGFAPMSGQPALQLNGRLRRNGAVIPVRFIVNEPLELKVNGQDVVVMNGDPYLSTLMLQVVNLTEGITADMMENAMVTPDGAILITEVSNTNIYQLVWANLNSDNFVKVKMGKKNKK